MSAGSSNDRVMKDVPEFPRFPLASNKLWKKVGKPDLEVLLKHLQLEGRVAIDDAVQLVKRARDMFRKEPNLLRLYDPITVCGDIHGQFFDLLRLMQCGGPVESTQYLFLGDYVDRGCFSCEVVLYMFAVKLTYPKQWFMLRGNHECRHLTAFFNFKDECLYKYNERLYNEIMSAFDALPIAATINSKFLCIHGGLSPDIQTLSDIQAINRFEEVPREGPFCDLLWSDPAPERGEDEDDDDFDPVLADTTWFAYNEARQCSYIFGVDAVEAFLKKNKLTSVIRAHEAQSQGYKMQMMNETTGIPRVITIFSAPNYCDAYGNKAACLKFDKEMLNIRQFDFSPHPYYLPNFMDVFSWSLPFVAEKVTDMLANVVNWCQDEPPEGAATDSSLLEKRGNILKEKVNAISKMLKTYTFLREESDLILQLKQLTPNSKLPVGIMGQGRKALETAITSFSEARKADAPNERLPPTSGGKKKSIRKNIVF
eukprot:202089_1